MFETFTLPSFNVKTYSNIGKQIIDKVLMNDIDISWLVGDQLLFQTNGLDHYNPHSLQNKFHDDPLYSSALYIPCICHILIRSLMKVIQKNTQLQKAVNLLNSLQVL